MPYQVDIAAPSRVFTQVRGVWICRDVEYGCTAIVGVFAAGKLIIGNAGDSRAFILSRQYHQVEGNEVMCQTRIMYVVVMVVGDDGMDQLSVLFGTILVCQLDGFHVLESRFAMSEHGTCVFFVCLGIESGREYG